MRIMIDTNVLLSSFLFPSPIMNAFINLVIDQHRIVLSSYIIDELNAVVAKKFPAKHNLVRHFFEELPYELFDRKTDFDKTLYPFVRDPKDLPVLVAAIESKVDILITGDKDLLEIDISKPAIMEVAKFVDYYG
jgi:putative PIN family toxin of toxin-antitoxin system